VAQARVFIGRVSLGERKVIDVGIIDADHVVTIDLPRMVSEVNVRTGGMLSCLTSEKPI
jgi:hypothetical protein